jgi:hypothetical protein
VSSSRSLLTWGRRRLGRGFGLLAGSKKGKVFRVRDVNWSFYCQKDLGRGARGAERRLRTEIRESLDIGNLLSFSSVFTGLEIPENVRVKCAI